MKVWEEWKNRAVTAEARVEALETRQEPLETRIRELQEELDRVQKMYEEEQAALVDLRTNALRYIEAAKEVCVDSYHQQSQREPV